MCLRFLIAGSNRVLCPTLSYIILSNTKKNSLVCFLLTSLQKVLIKLVDGELLFHLLRISHTFYEFSVIRFYFSRFYTLLVISTALFNKPPFKNLIANGLILASDGQKMSKRKKNYPDPMEVSPSLRYPLRTDNRVVRANYRILQKLTESVTFYK